MEFGHLIDARLKGLVAESRSYYAHRVPRRGPSNLEQLRAVRAAAAATTPAASSAGVQITSSDGCGVPLRIYAPTSGAAHGVHLQFHGGGFYLGPTAGDDVRNRALTERLGLVVVSPDYRLAPEHPWPAAPDDCEVAARWLVEHAEQFFGAARLSIGGFSAGSTLAMTTLLRLRDRGIHAYQCAALQFGTYDLSGQTPAGRLIADEYFLDAYAGSARDRTQPDLSPIYADLTGLPPVLIVVGADDVLLQDNLAMAARLSTAGVDIDLRVYPASPHGFTAHPTSMAGAATDDITGWLAEQLQLPVPRNR